jgi:hypothetical protein
VIGGLFRLLRVVAIGSGKLLTATRIISAASIVAVLVIGLSLSPAVSLPLYARQTTLCDLSHCFPGADAARPTL